ncbi:hypothetical protein LF41_2405 [Lysobacter dokdonensis DS-58]|uniref:Uncharacterized protein n=1 Tax=Lysobacter dokdonensis DS-58 TaxID=1300345 RepID=A0A0A2WJ98_9GAMM|nr:hypothetical protein [Lysobacter dokdonensis]KGQ19898.1 hypothetical protein LF41_2405 [Lysobacter dokdonensis DS-58]
MGKLTTSFEDHGDHLRVVAIIWPRRNGLPNLACMKRAMAVLEEINPDTFDPIEGVSEDVARAAMRDRPVEQITLAENQPPVPVFEEDEIPGPRCNSGVCLGD